MGARLRGKHKKQARTAARTVKEGKTPRRHKVAKRRSATARYKKNNRQT